MWLNCVHRSYGVTLWYPTYVDRLSKESLESVSYHDDCNHTLSNYSASSFEDDLEKLFCACPTTDFQDVTLEGITLDEWWAYDSSITNVFVQDSSLKEVWFHNVTMDTVHFQNVTFSDSHLTMLTLRDVIFSNVTFVNSSLCNISNDGVSFKSTIFTGSNINGITPTSDQEALLGIRTTNGSCGGDLALPTNCIPGSDEVDLGKEYFYDFIIAASALPGNIASAIAVYLFRRSFWLGE